jgi:peptide/nickel transport system substrate-binding protein
MRILLLLLMLCCAGGAMAQGTLRIGIGDDPDALDPTLNRAASGRQPLTAVCDKLFDVTTELKLEPQLVTSYEIAADGLAVTLKLREGVRFHDGEVFDAEAVAFNLNRHLTMQGSLRRTELGALAATEVVDPGTIRLLLKSPQAYLLLINLAERAGMMVSPKAAREAGERFALHPVCAGAFRFVERVPQGRIVVQRFDGYWNRANIHLDRIEYLPISDSTVRLAGLRSGELQIAERLSPTDLPQLRGDPRVTSVATPDLGFHAIRFNMANGPRQRIFGGDIRIRQAVEAAIDRRAMVQALFEDQYTAGNQFVGPESVYYDKAHPVPPRNVARARALLREAGQQNLTFTLLVPSERERQEAAQMVQAMLAEAGITMRIETQDNTSLLASSQRGQFDAVFSFWSGRPHPDGNSYSHFACAGPLNDSRYCNQELDALLTKGREASDEAERVRLYREANALLVRDVPHMVVWHRRTFTGLSRRLVGFVPHPDSTIRLVGLRLN